MKDEIITISKKVYETDEKMRFFGVSPEEIYKKKFNIFIGISITNKKINPTIVHNYLEWALRNTKDKVAVIIADELNIVNYEILDGYSSGKARNRAKKVGDKFENLFNKQIIKFSEKEQKKVIIYRWKDVVKSGHFQQLRNFIEEEYKRDFEFRSAILYFIRKFMRRKGRIIKNQNKIDIFIHLYFG